MVFKTKGTEAALEKALQNTESLTEEEVEQIKDFLNMVKTLGRLGRFIIWAVITLGTLAAAFHQFKLSVGIQ